MFGSAPYSRSRRVFASSPADHMSAVAPASFVASGSAPSSSRRCTSATSLYSTARIRGGTGSAGVSPAASSGHSAPPIDPFLDRGNLFCRERSRGRHLHPEPVVDQPLIQPARGAVAGTGDLSGPAGHRLGPLIESKPAYSYRQCVLAIADLAYSCVHVAHAIDSGPV